MKKTGLAFFLAVLSCTANAASYQVISGSLDIYDTVPNGVGFVTLTGNGSFQEGVFDGSANGNSSDPSATSAGIAQVDFLTIPMDFYFAESGVFDAPGAVHAAPSIDLASMTADMRSLFVNWNSDPSSGYIGEFNIGGIAAVTALGGSMFSLEWSTVQVDGPFTGFQTDMTLVVSPVPVPTAVWLMGSGLLALIGVSRRKL